MSKVEVKSSTIPNAGNGVFVKKNVKKGEYLCIYDGEVVNSKDVNIITTDMSYAISDGDKTILGYKTPKTNEGVAQLVNDGAIPIITDENNYNSVLKSFLDYEKKSLSLMNCVIDEVAKDKYINGKEVSKFIAGKDLQKGQELFYSYGTNYWMMKFFSASTNSFLRLIIYSIMASADYDTLTDEIALYIFEAVMNQDLKSEYWTETFKSNKPKDFLLKIINQCGIPKKAIKLQEQKHQQFERSL